MIMIQVVLSQEGDQVKLKIREVRKTLQILLKVQKIVKGLESRKNLSHLTRLTYQARIPQRTNSIMVV